jgi:predicted esterase
MVVATVYQPANLLDTPNKSRETTMNHRLQLTAGLAALCLLLADRSIVAQDDVADVPSQDLRVGNDKNKRYFLIGPTEGATEPEAGYGLVVVLPGGGGDADFHPFVKRIFQNAVPDGYLVAQLVAVKWSAKQQIVWPTGKARERGMKFTTEQFIDAVIGDVEAKHKLDPQRIFTLSWSSGGPAAYAASLMSKKVKGSFVAMSVFKPNQLAPLEKAKGHRYFIYHSQEDQICPYRMAKQAELDLKGQGAETKLHEYAGGHGWTGPVFDDISMGLEWLAETDAAAAPANTP